MFTFTKKNLYYSIIFTDLIGDLFMKVSPINNFYFNVSKNNQTKTQFKSYYCQTEPCQAMFSEVITEKGKNVLDYVNQGCPKTQAGAYEFKRIFGNTNFDLSKNKLSIQDMLNKCDDNLEVIDRALGKYGLEAYGNLKAGSTIKDKRDNLVETGYFFKGADMHDNFLNYINANKKGTFDEITERFGEKSYSYLDGWEKVGVFRTFLDGYSIVNDRDGDSSELLNAEWDSARAKAVHTILGYRA